MMTRHEHDTTRHHACAASILLHRPHAPWCVGRAASHVHSCACDGDAIGAAAHAHHSATQQLPSCAVCASLHGHVQHERDACAWDVWPYICATCTRTASSRSCSHPCALPQCSPPLVSSRLVWCMHLLCSRIARTRTRRILCNSSSSSQTTRTRAPQHRTTHTRHMSTTTATATATVTSTAPTTQAQSKLRVKRTHADSIPVTHVNEPRGTRHIPISAHTTSHNDTLTDTAAATVDAADVTTLRDWCTKINIK